MNNRTVSYLISIIVLLEIIIVLALPFNVFAKELKFQQTPIKDALAAISREYSVKIIADPRIEGKIDGYVTTNKAGEALDQILTPIKCTASLIDGYYVVGNVKSPLSLQTATTKSTIIPVGFLGDEVPSILKDYKEYLTYDEKSKILRIDASEKMTYEILNSLWSEENKNQEYCIVYHVQLIDITDSSLANRIFSYDSSKPLVISTVGNNLDNSVLDGIKSMSRDFDVSQSWLLAAPGKISQISNSYENIRDNIEGKFRLALKPGASLQNGMIATEIEVESSASIASKKSAVSAVITTKPGVMKVVAAAQVSITSKAGQAIFYGNSMKVFRDCLIAITAFPVPLRAYSNASVFQATSLNGMDIFSAPQSILRSADISKTFSTTVVSDESGMLWKFDYSMSLSPGLTISAGMTMDSPYDYRSKFELALVGGYWLEGKYLTKHSLDSDNVNRWGIVQIGVGDKTTPVDWLTLSTTYYPYVRIYDDWRFIGQSSIVTGSAHIGQKPLGAYIEGTLQNKILTGNAAVDWHLSDNSVLQVGAYIEKLSDPEYYMKLSMSI